MSIDTKLINRKISLINKDLKNLTQIQEIPLAKFLKSDDYEALAERYLERIVGRMIDINYHILSESEKEMPNDYRDSFIIMGRKGYLDMGLANNLSKSAGLRNVLAHDYDEIDEKKVYESIGRCLQEVPRYLGAVVEFLEKLSKQKKLS